MINIGYHAARLQGHAFRFLYQSALPRLALRCVRVAERIPCVVYSFSGQNDLPEQVVNIRSFLSRVGVPDRFVIVSDGSHTDVSASLLRRINGCIEFIDWKQMTAGKLPDCVISYTEKGPLGKKLAVLMSLPVSRPTIYTDSDVIFFSETAELRKWCASSNASPLFLRDCVQALDLRLLRPGDETCDSVNSGFMMLKAPLDWSNAVERLRQSSDEPIYHTEQTMVHLAMHSSQAQPLNSESFVISLRDQFQYREDYVDSSTTLRHYVGPVRHKFWARAWRVYA